MKKDQLKKSEGFVVRLRPTPIRRNGEAVDADWHLAEVADNWAQLADGADGYSVRVGLDNIHSFSSDPSRDSAGQRYGFLTLHVQLIYDGITIHQEPLSPRTGGSVAAALHLAIRPLVVPDGTTARYFTWRGRDPVHRITQEEPPRQLYAFAAPLCRELHKQPGVEPQFNLPTRLHGEIVYEVSPDLQAKWRLLGGMGERAGDQILVVVPRP